MIWHTMIIACWSMDNIYLELLDGAFHGIHRMEYVIYTHGLGQKGDNPIDYFPPGFIQTYHIPLVSKPDDQDTYYIYLTDEEMFWPYIHGGAA